VDAIQGGFAVSEWWAFGADIAVAIGTLGLAWFTARLARETKRLARETAEDVRAGSRPVLIDAAGTTATMTTTAGENRGGVQLTVRNVGDGPALNAYAYVLAATRNENRQSKLTPVGNVAPDTDVNAVLADVLTRNVSGSVESYLFLRVIFGYTDLGGRRYHSVVRLQDPNHGQRTTYDREPNSTESPVQPLRASGTEVGEGAAPPPQWRVSFAGRELPEEFKARLRANAMLHMGGHGLPGGSWSFSVIVSADRATEAIELVQTALGPGAPFVGYAAEPWKADPFALQQWSRSTRVVRRVARSVRLVRRK
jgi:hypothetical protein